MSDWIPRRHLDALTGALVAELRPDLDMVSASYGRADGLGRETVERAELLLQCGPGEERQAGPINRVSREQLAVYCTKPEMAAVRERTLLVFAAVSIGAPPERWGYDLRAAGLEDVLAMVEQGTSAIRAETLREFEKRRSSMWPSRNAVVPLRDFLNGAVKVGRFRPAAAAQVGFDLRTGFGFGWHGWRPTPHVLVPSVAARSSNIDPSTL